LAIGKPIESQQLAGLSMGTYQPSQDIKKHNTCLGSTLKWKYFRLTRGEKRTAIGFYADMLAHFN